MFINRAGSGKNFVENCLKVKINAVAKVGEESYMIHQLLKISNPKNPYSEVHTVWWVTNADPFLLKKMVSWAHLSESEEWKVITALQTEYQEIEGIKIPKVYESYQNRLKDKSDDFQKITFAWKEVNKPYSPELFSEKLLEPKADTFVFDARGKVDGAIGVPYGAPKIKTLTPEQSNSSGFLYWIYAINLIVIVIIAVYLIFRRNFKKK
ncbi:hypothetical protein Pan241w_18100 [Gimesia alba]|uniref:Uncharacterized protein n=2 Tax=Gimesia alba TaxID=2527973 RepID=A0A517RCY6_9PLAN|nr:hypothetical protein Pan241w_18100 [Gimesia alba]